MRRFALLVLVACGKNAADPDAMGPLVAPDAPHARLSIDPPAHDFGPVIVVCSAAPATFTVTNTGNGSSEPLATALAGLDADEFRILQDGCTTRSLAPGESCTIQVGTGTLNLGSDTANVIATAGAEQVSASFFVEVFSTLPLRVTPSMLKFGTVAVGATSTTSFTVSNDAMCPPSKMLSTTLAGSDPSFFSTTNDTCSNTILAGGESCTVGVVFAPTAPGPRWADVEVGIGLDVGLVGATPGNTLAITPASLAFGPTPAGMTSAQQAIYIDNGGPPTAPLSVSASGDTAAFTIIDMCSGVSLATNAYCMLLVTFAPTTAGTFNAQYLASAGPGGTVQPTVQGVAGPPADFAIEPKFGLTFSSCSTNPVDFKVTNVGPTAFGPLATAIAGTDAGNFAIGPDACSGATLAPGATCTLAIRFVPTGPPAGAKSGELQVTATGAQEAHVPLNGSTAPGLSASTCGLTFSGVTPGTTATQTFTVTNEGAMMTGPLQVSQSGANGMLFPTSGCAGQTLALFESCTMTVTFAPIASGAFSTYVDVSASPGGLASVEVFAN